MKNTFASDVLKCLLVCGVIVCASPAQALQDKIVAVVNDELITLSELKSYITTSYVAMKHKGLSSKDLEKFRKDLEANGLNRLIEDKLILSKANELKVKIGDKSLEDRMNSVKNQYPSEQAFIDALTASGTTVADLKTKFSDQIKIKMLVDSLVKNRVRVNPQEAIRYYKQHLDEFWQKESAELNSIFIEFGEDKAVAKQKLDNVVDMIKSGKSFTEVAAEYSDHPSIGVVKKGDLVKQIEDVIFSLQDGQVSPVVETDTGYYLFQMKERHEMEVVPFREVREKIHQILGQQKFKKQYDELLTELKKNAYVEIKQ